MGLTRLILDLENLSLCKIKNNLNIVLFYLFKIGHFCFLLFKIKMLITNIHSKCFANVRIISNFIA